jgi:DNA-binding GntR family transcriptional regulator
MAGSGAVPPTILSHGSTVDRTLRQLRSRILLGKVLPGEQIRQEDMASELGVSRVPLREALRVLAQEGLLQHQRNRGYFVAKRGLHQLAQIHLMLHQLETALMRTIGWPDEALLRELAGLNDEMRGVVEREDWTPLLALNRRFHFGIFQLSPLDVIRQEVERLWIMAEPYLTARLAPLEVRRQTIAEHSALLEALRACDRAASIELLDRHREKTYPEPPPVEKGLPELEPLES